MGSPPAPEPVGEVMQLLAELGITPRMIKFFYKLFRKLKQNDPLTLQAGDNEVSVNSVCLLVKTHRRWVARILALLWDLAGFRELVSWDGFLFVLLNFCRMSKVELCQVMFYLIAMDMKSWSVVYLTATQLEEFYSDYDNCPLDAFNTKEIDFSRLPQAKYRLHEFVELMFRFNQLINPCLHLQRSLQEALPNLRFWQDYDRVKLMNRPIPIDFFRVRKVKNVHQTMIEKSQGAQQKVVRGMSLPVPSRVEEAEDPEEAALRVLKADAEAGFIPAPVNVSWPEREKVEVEEELRPWLEQLVMSNADPATGFAMGTAAERAQPQEKTLRHAIQSCKTVEEAKELIKSTFAPAVIYDPDTSGVKPIVHLKASQRGSQAEETERLLRVQALDFIRKNRMVQRETPSMVERMDQIFQCELMTRKKNKPPL